MPGRFEELESFYRGKTVLVTGHTGFKGSWLVLWLHKMGAKVVGYALPPTSQKYIYSLARLDKKIQDITGDVREYEHLKRVMSKYKPDIVFHLAAKAIVRESYDNPKETFETNVLGTVNVLEAMKESGGKVAVMITTDKCYKNKERMEGYSEDDELGGYDPYSASKASAELAIAMYRNVTKESKMRIASTRAGNVIGGGDWGSDRIIPDMVRAYEEGKELMVRNPSAIRPWQFVLEPLYGYLLVGMNLYKGEPVDEAWNFGPTDDMKMTVRELVDAMGRELQFARVKYGEKEDNKHETKVLMLNWKKAKERLGWHPQLKREETVRFVAEWYKEYKNENVYGLCARQIDAYTKKNG